MDGALTCERSDLGMGRGDDSEREGAYLIAARVSCAYNSRGAARPERAVRGTPARERRNRFIQTGWDVARVAGIVSPKCWISFQQIEETFHDAIFLHTDFKLRLKPPPGWATFSVSRGLSYFVDAVSAPRYV